MRDKKGWGIRMRTVGRGLGLLVVFFLLGGSFAFAAPIVLRDHLDREVVLEEYPRGVLALARAYMEDLFELGVTPLGRVEEYTLRAEGVALPSVGSQSKPNLEAILALNPALVLGNTRHHTNLIELLEGAGIKIFLFDPNKVEEDPLTDRIRILGDLLGLQQEASTYVEELDALSRQLREALVPYSYTTGLIVQGGVESIQVAMPTGLFGALFTRLGIQNIVPSNLPGSGQSTWVQYDLEEIIKADPQVIVVRAQGGSGQNAESLLSFYRESPLWSHLRAVREDRIFILPARVNSGTISNFDALKVTFDVLTKTGK